MDFWFGFVVVATEFLLEYASWCKKIDPSADSSCSIVIPLWFLHVDDLVNVAV